MRHAKWIRGAMAVLAVALVSSCGKNNNDGSNVGGINSGIYGGDITATGGCISLGAYGNQNITIPINFQATDLYLDNVQVLAGYGYGRVDLGGPGAGSPANIEKTSRFANLYMNIYSGNANNTRVSLNSYGTLILQPLAVQEIIFRSGGNSFNFNQPGYNYVNQTLCFSGIPLMNLSRSNGYASGGLMYLQLSNGLNYPVQF